MIIRYLIRMCFFSIGTLQNIKVWIETSSHYIYIHKSLWRRSNYGQSHKWPSIVYFIYQKLTNTVYIHIFFFSSPTWIPWVLNRKPDQKLIGYFTQLINIKKFQLQFLGRNRLERCCFGCAHFLVERKSFCRIYLNLI